MLALPGTDRAESLRDSRLIGDWEPPDAILTGRQSLWAATTDSIMAAAAHLPVHLVSPAGDGHESAWVRDYGPLQVERHGRVVWLDAVYHLARPRDDALPDSLGALLGIDVERLPLRLDGGGVASNGRGLCAMTGSTLQILAPLQAPEIARRLGCHELVAVPPLSGEPTGHVDLLVQFLGPGVVAVAEPGGAGVSADDRGRLDLAARRLAAAARSMGQQLEIVRVPVYRGADGLLFSYVNVVALRDQLLVPEFSDVPPEIQREAHATLRRASGKTLVGIPADAIALAGGGLHCIVLGLHLRGG